MKLIVGERHERFLHPGPSRSEIYVRAAVHPDPAPVQVGDELRERFATYVETHAPYVWRKVRVYLSARVIAKAFCYGSVGLGVCYFAGHVIAAALR